jgi:hypothetical protein
MANGTPLVQFNSFMEATGPLYITGPDGVINDAQAQKTYSFGAIMGGDRGMKKMLAGGSEVRFATFFETGSRTRFHQPGATQNWAQPQKLTHGRSQMRYLITDMAWTIQEIMQNERITRGRDSDEVFHQFVDLKRQKEQMMWTDKWDFMENHVWSEPDFTEMETNAGGEFGKWYSIPAFINEYDDGLYNSGGGSAGTAWTTIHGLDPTSTVQGQTGYTHQTAVYSNEVVTLGDISRAGSLMGSFEKMWKKCHFEKPPTMGEYFSDPAYNNQQIFTSEAGQTAYNIMLRAFQDNFVIGTRQDPAYTDPSFNFIPVKYVNALQAATLYPNNTTPDSATDNVAENGTVTGTKKGPRYYWINSNYLYPFFHEDMFFERQSVREHFNDPDTFVMPVRTWGNFKCTSRKRQGLISPSDGKALYTNLYV